MPRTLDELEAKLESAGFLLSGCFLMHGPGHVPPAAGSCVYKDDGESSKFCSQTTFALSLAADLMVVAETAVQRLRDIENVASKGVIDVHDDANDSGTSGNNIDAQSEGNAKGTDKGDNEQ